MGPPSNLQPCLPPPPPPPPPPPGPPSPSDPHLLPPLSHVEIIPQESIDFSKLHLSPPTAAGEGGAAHCFPTPPPHPIEQFPPPLPPPTQDQQAMFYSDGCMDTMIVAMEHPSPNGDFEEFSPQPKYISL